MGLRGFPGLSGEMCQEKFKSLKRRYKNVDKKKKTGTAPYRFEFFKEMGAIFGKDPDIHPLVTYNSSHNKPAYREDLAALESSISKTPLSQNAAYQHTPSTSSTPDDPISLENETPRTIKKRELPQWCHQHFQRMDGCLGGKTC